MTFLVIKLKYNPCFNQLDNPDNYTYFSCAYDDGKIYGYVAYIINNSNAMIHFEFVEFTHTSMKEVLKDWGQIKKILIDEQVKIIAVVNEIDIDLVWDRFIRKFGFGEPQNVRFRIAQMEV